MTKPTESRASPQRPMRRWSLKVLKVGLLACVLALVGRELLVRLSALPVDMVVNYRFLAIGGLLTILALAMIAAIYGVMLFSLGYSEVTVASLVVAWVSPLGKYIPGKAGAVVGAIWISSRFGIPVRAAVAATILSASATFSAGGLFLFPYLAEDLAPADIDWLLPIIAMMVVFGVVLAFPAIGIRLFDRLWRVMGRGEIGVAVKPGPYLFGVLLTLFQLLVMGAALWFLLSAVAAVTIHDLYVVVASLVIAGLIGFFAFFAPAGIGVREGLLLVLLQAVAAQEPLALAVVLLRVVQLLGELLLFLCGLTLWAWQRRAAASFHLRNASSSSTVPTRQCNHPVRR